MEAKQAVGLARAGLAQLGRTSRGLRKNHKKKALRKAEEATKEAKAKTPETKAETKKAVEDAKGTMTAAASEMFAFYSKLLSPESKYLWNKIVSKPVESDPFVNLQGVSLEGPRGMSCKLFNNCVMFHLLTAFPINAAEQEKYYITNVLKNKKPQHVNVRQFVHCVEQLNAYIAQMPCFYYSPNANVSTKPENAPFTEAELGSHVLHMCPIQWQDQYNMNKKGMTPIDMRSLLTLVEAIKHVCTYKKAKPESYEKASNKGKKGKKSPCSNSTARVPKKVHFEAFLQLVQEAWGCVYHAQHS